MINIFPKNDVFIVIRTDRSTEMDLQDYFSFFVPNRHFIPAVKKKLWDGRIRLYSLKDNTLYKGLLPYVYKFAKRNDIIINNTIPIMYCSKPVPDDPIGILNPYVSGQPITARDYQLVATKHAIEAERALLLSPTSSGKSLIIYALIRHYIDLIEAEKKKILISVPTTNLVSQLYSDFVDYSSENGFDCDIIHMLKEGAAKDTDKSIVISTWQSIFKQPLNYFKQFKMIVGDEAHLFNAKSLVGIMEKLTDCPFRFGTTGTIDDTESKVNKLVLEGLFGPIFNVTSTKKLMDDGHVSKLYINSIVLRYQEEIRKSFTKVKYQDEIAFLINNKQRNNFIQNLAIKEPGNVLLLFNQVAHGETLFKAIREKSKKDIHFIYGEVAADDRESIRNLVSHNNNIIIVASLGTMSTGANIPNIQAIIFAHPSKSKVRNLQSIGRGLRLDGKDNKAILYDIADDLSYKKHQNFGLKHWMHRIEMYNKELFEYSIYKINI